MNRLRLVSFLGLGFSLLLSGCLNSRLPAFGHHFLDNQEDQLAAIMEQLPDAAHDDRPENVLAQPIVVLTTHAENTAERRLVAWNIEQDAPLWSLEMEVSTRPEILGDVVLVSRRHEVMAFDLRTGQSLWTAQIGDLAYVGATRDGDTIYFSSTVGVQGGARRVGHVSAVNARTGSERWRHEVQGVFGQPAAQGGLLFVPWERQNIAILSEEDGVELARLRSTDDVVSWAFDHPTGIYYGSGGIYRLTHRSVTGVRAESTHLSPPMGQLPRQPDAIWEDGFTPKPGTRSARGKIRVYFNPAPAPNAETITIEGDTFYFAYYRYVFAYGLDGTLRWARILEQDVVNAEAMPHGLLTVGAQGRVSLLDVENGSSRWSRELNLEVASVQLDAAGFDPEAPTHSGHDLRQSLNQVALDPDNRLVAARAYAVQQLARMDDPAVTRDLLDLYGQRSMPGALKAVIRDALRSRRSGSEHLVAALEGRYDYLENTQAPPLEAIVPALLEMESRDAVPRLMHHLMDHETPVEVLPTLVDAIVRLGGSDALPALRRFLVLYRYDSLFDGAVEDAGPSEEHPEGVQANPAARALALAAQGIFQLGGPEQREFLTSISGETPQVHAAVATYVRGLFESESSAAAARQRAEEEAAQVALAEAARQAEAALPLRLAQSDVNNTFGENADALRECIGGELERNPRLMQVRLVFILSNNGQASDITVAPNTPELVECLSTSVGAFAFPRFRQRRMRASFVVGVRGGVTQASTAGAQRAVERLAEDAEWWEWFRFTAMRQGANDDIPSAISWWTPREAPATPVVATTEVEAETVERPPGATTTVVTTTQQDSAAAGSEAPADDAAAAPESEVGSTVSAADSTTDGADPDADGTQAPEAPASDDGGTPWWAGASEEDGGSDD